MPKVPNVHVQHNKEGGLSGGAKAGLASGGGILCESCSTVTLINRNSTISPATLKPVVTNTTLTASIRMTTVNQTNQ